mgnify:CR=1 FL=1
MFRSGSVGGAVGPVTVLLLSTCGCLCRKVLYESLGIVRQHPNSTKNAPTEVQIRVGMRIFDEFRVFAKTVSQERAWTPHNVFHNA